MCRKKSKTDIELENNEELATQQIDSSLDILNIVRDLNTLKVLAHLLLRPRHMGLAPLIGFKAFCSESKGDVEDFLNYGSPDSQTGKISSRKQTFKPFRRNNRRKNCLGIHKEDYSKTVRKEIQAYSHWQTELQEQAITDDKLVQAIKKNMDRLTDEYYKKYIVRDTLATTLD